jgi:predicted acylesterase/phospholipase RssA
MDASPIKLANAFKEIAQEEFDKVKQTVQTKSFSDVTDNEGHQYVNLIQEGGGVWGIALVGYTYVLEMAGIRFLKMAGTSAGAINTIFLASMPNPKSGQLKSETIANLLADLNFFNLVDGHWFARKLIKNLITNNGYAKQVFFSLRTFLFMTLGLLYIANILQWSDINTNRFALVAVALMALVPLLAYRKARSNFKKDHPNEEIKACDLRNVSIPDDNDGIFSREILIVGAALFLILLFSLGYILNDQSPTCLLYLDLGALVILVIAALLLNDQFDSDFLTLGTLLFVLLTIFSFGLGQLKIPIFYNSSLQLFLAGIVIFLISIFTGGIRPRVIVYLVILLGLVVFFLGLSGLMTGDDTHSSFSYLSLAATLLFTFLVVIVGGFTLFFYLKFKTSEFGINPGDYFQCWVRKELKKFNGGQDYLVGDLERIWSENASIIQLKTKPGNRSILFKEGNCESTVDDLKKYDRANPPIVIISSDISSQSKAEFPKMTDLYWGQNEKIYVADFVRASMAIPIFFEPFKRTGIPQNQAAKWDAFFGYKFGGAPPFDNAYFVDGGILSNFPFNVFHNPAIKNARIPTFGIRLESSDEKNNTAIEGLFDYVSKIFNVARGYYDQDFLLKNPYYRQCIHSVDMKGYNWLNFFVGNEEKKVMFRIGAEAACKFLESFDWEEFRKQRDQGVDKLCNCKP